MKYYVVSVVKEYYYNIVMPHGKLPMKLNNGYTFSLDSALLLLLFLFSFFCCFYRSTYMVYVYEQVSTAMELSRLIYAYKNDDNDNGNNGDRSVIIKLFHRKVESICTFSCIRTTLYISNVYEVMGKKHGRSCSPQFFSV